MPATTFLHINGALTREGAMREDRSLREDENILQYSRLEYVIVAQYSPRVFKAHTIRDVHLKYSNRIWWNTLR